MNNFKFQQHDERSNVAIRKSEAISFIRTLRLAGFSSSRQFISQEEMLTLMLNRSGRIAIDRLLEQPGNPETDDICFREIDGVIVTLEDLQAEMIPIRLVLSLMPRKGTPLADGDDILDDLLGSEASGVHEIAPFHFAMAKGTPIPPGGGRSDPLTKNDAASLYELFNAAARCVAQGREAEEMGQQLDIERILERLRPRALFLLRLRGHHFRERIPALGYNCCPCSGDLAYLGIFKDLYNALIKKNTGQFFRYPLLFQEFENLISRRLIELARAKKRGRVPVTQKIKILTTRVDTGEESMTVAMVAMAAFYSKFEGLTAILGHAPGKIDDWVEITWLGQRERYAEDIEHFLANPQYPKDFKAEIPDKYLNILRDKHLIIEENEFFSLSPELRQLAPITFVDYFSPEGVAHPALHSRYDFVFYIKVMEYLMSDPKGLEQASVAQILIEYFDSGRLLVPGGIFLTDHDKLRSSWSNEMLYACVEGVAYAALRRAGPPGIENILGPARSAGTSALELMASGDVPIPITASPLDPYCLTPVAFGYPMNEVAIYTATGKHRTRQEREIADLVDEIGGYKREKQALLRPSLIRFRGGRTIEGSIDPKSWVEASRLDKLIQEKELQLSLLKKEGEQ